MPRRSCSRTPAPAFGIEARYRLVGDDEIRLLRQRSCDRDALLLAARQPVGALAGVFEQADAIEALQGEQRVPPLEAAQPAAPRRDMAQPSPQARSAAQSAG